MRKRLPYLLVALGLFGVSLYPRLVSAGAVPPWMRDDFALGLGMGIFLGIEIVGMLMTRRASLCAT